MLKVNVLLNDEDHSPDSFSPILSAKRDLKLGAKNSLFFFFCGEGRYQVQL